MSHPDPVSQGAYPLSPPLDNQKMSRRMLLRRITGLVLMGSSLTTLDLACNSTSNIAPARQSPTSPL
jgi:hypothetical protein